MQASPDPAENHFLIDLSARAKLRLSGADRVRFLNGQVSNDVRRASAEQSVYACVMTIKGKMCADVFIHAEGDSLLIDSEGELRESLAARLERYIIADDVLLEDATEEMALFHLLAATPDSLPGMAAVFIDLKPQVQAVHSQRFGRLGVDLFFAASQRKEVRSRLTAVSRFCEPDTEELEALRIRAGTPRWGAELNENTMPAEAGLEARAVDYAKGCYIGQEIVSRIKSVGHVNRSLCGLRAVDPHANLTAGMLLYPVDADEEPRAREAGRITSVAHSIALGYVRRGWETVGSLLDAVDPASDRPEPSPPSVSCRVEICPLPFPP